MKEHSIEDVSAARAPIASLISKSEKAQQKLSPGTWQHTMLQENLHALHVVLALIDGDSDVIDHATPNDLEAATRALTAMAARTQKAQANFSPGTSQHTLAKNRLRSLEIGEALVKARLDSAESADS